jgi:diguanylate cyclase (GGDEF)-like protein
MSKATHLSGALEDQLVDKVTDTLISLPERRVSTHNRDACLVHIYPTGTGMGKRYPLRDHPLIIGRGVDCDICIQDQSVSRRHVRIQPSPTGYTAVDMQSTNGTFINDVAVPEQPLKDGDYLRVGNCIYRFLAGGNVEAEYHEEIYRLTIIDALTESPNKRYLFDFLDRELARSARHHRPLAVCLFDIDHFKTINDELGHLAGDFTLRELSARIRSLVRREELFARYGGEEFVLVLPETTLEGARHTGERVRAMVAERSFQFEERAFNITVSIGIAATNGEEPLTPNDLVRRADEKLYQAKHAGRNRVAG